MVLNSHYLVDIITQNVNTIVIVINRKGELIYISKSVERILGYQPEELLGEYWWKATRKDDFSALEMLNSFKEHVRNNEIEALSSERLLFDSKRNQKWILWNSSMDEDGNVVSVGYDITNRKKNETRLKQSNALLKTKNKEILDSLKYAQSIQNSILPNKQFFRQHFSDGFVIYEPKDFVSGDFYWYYEIDELVFIACIDCTGHGVPGALMTILANSLLKNVIKHQHLRDPGEILHALDSLLYEEFNKNSKIKRADGMDISLCIFDFNKKELAYAGALHSMFVKKHQSNELLEFKGKRYPIGLYHDVTKNFESEKISFEQGDCFFLYSDGIIDQFGGEKNKKYTKKRFQETIQFDSENFAQTEDLTLNSFSTWKGKNEQTDDVLVLGLKI